jgi:serine/threonine-protein kinase
VKLVDFGLAVPCGSSGSLSGTPFYMSPEQIECRSVDGRTDIYSLGLTAYEMVCGHRPYPDADAFRAMILHLENDIPDPATTMPDLPSPLRDFIVNACRRDSGERYASAHDALNALEGVLHHLDIAQ